MATQPLTARDPLTLALFGAVVFHMGVILGVGFTAPLPKSIQQPMQSLEVTLVHSHSAKPPQEADYLAQANQEGGGEVEERVRPSSPLPNHSALEERGPALETLPPQPPQQSEPKPERKRITTVTTAPTQSPAPPPEQPKPEQPEPQPEPTPLLLRSQEIARLSAEIREQQQLYAQQPRLKYITANTREYLFATYEDSWRQKVERVGTLNYPAEAIAQQLTGTLLLDVAIRANGELESIQILKSSGSPILDEGAVQILQLAAPFAPFSPQMREKVDILHITRAWQFRDETLHTY